MHSTAKNLLYVYMLTVIVRCSYIGL